MTDSRGHRPNILFLLSDQHRPGWLGSNPDVSVRTPNIDRLADRGVRFENAICPSPLCAPSRASLISGMEYHGHDVDHNLDDYPTDGRTYFRDLRDNADYYVMGCGPFDLEKGSQAWGRRRPEQLGCLGSL